MSLTYSRVVQLSPGFLQALCLWVLSRLTSSREETMAFEDPAQCPLNCEVFLPGCWGCNFTHSPCELRKRWYQCPSRSPDLGGISHMHDGQHSLSAVWVFCAQLPRAPGSCTPILSGISPPESSLPGALVAGLRLHRPPCARQAAAGEELKGRPSRGVTVQRRSHAVLDAAISHASVCFFLLFNAGCENWSGSPHHG